MKTAVASSNSASTASRISSAVTTRTVRTPAGGASAVGPLTSATWAPRRAAARARAYPIFPDDRLERKRTGSNGSRLGPAVTTTRSPVRSPGRSSRRTSSTMAAGSGRRPLPS